MSIPLDRLYHYIESVAQEIYNDDVIIYRFSPHGSKKLSDLNPLRNDIVPRRLSCVQVFCYDQEPLNYKLYENYDVSNVRASADLIKEIAPEHHYLWQSNLRSGWEANVYDKCVLLHSEQRSKNVALYSADNFVPCYYWNHAVLALDWFRYAQHLSLKKQTSKTFLIYNRAWSNTREYRLKFADLLIENALLDQCQTSFNPIDQVHYQSHEFNNLIWKPRHELETFFPLNTFSSCYSADFVEQDYAATDIEVVLETLFDDTRLHLTEKSLRPIALAQPFILCAPHGSLSYLRDYGFQTFDGVFDETYDTVQDPQDRLQSVLETMKQIAQWSNQTKTQKLCQAQEIADFNKKHFFSDKFFYQVITELTHNLSQAIAQVVSTNTSSRFIERQKTLSTTNYRKYMGKCLADTLAESNKQFYIKGLKLARQFYNQHQARAQ